MSTPRGRGRGTNRGKAMRARGRRGVGRGALFGERLLLESERSAEMTEEELEEIQQKYAKRGLGSNADRYEEIQDEEEESDDGADEEISAILEKKRQSELPHPTSSFAFVQDEDEDVDHTLSHISSTAPTSSNHLGTGVAGSKKGNVQTMEWDPELEEMRREIDRVEGMRDLKSRFRAKSERLLRPSSSQPRAKTKKGEAELRPAPALETMEPLTSDLSVQKNAKEGDLYAGKKDIEEMEDFLDDLLG